MQSFTCPHCGETHEGLPTDWGFRLPDDVFELSYIDRYRLVRSNVDLCTLGERRYFVRGLLLLPFSDKDGDFGWGIWVEVNRVAHDACMEQIDKETDGSLVARLKGRVANSMPGYGVTKGLSVEVQLSEAGDRPTFWLPKSSRHILAREQRHGISGERHHKLLEACGHFRRSVS